MATAALSASEELASICSENSLDCNSFHVRKGRKFLVGLIAACCRNGETCFAKVLSQDEGEGVWWSGMGIPSQVESCS